MPAFLITLVLLGCLLWWMRAWARGSRFARGLLVGVLLVPAGIPLVRAALAAEHLPAWAPALPFALVALALFTFGALAWHWGED